MPSPFPLTITNKVNSPELLAYLLQFGSEHYLSAEDINMIIAALNYLHQNTGSGIQSVTGNQVNNDDPANPIINIPTLGQVTDAGNVTGYIAIVGVGTTMHLSPDGIQINVLNETGGYSKLAWLNPHTGLLLKTNSAANGSAMLKSDLVTTNDVTIQLPSQSGTLALQSDMVTVEDATDSVKGVVKIYSSTGSNTDGTMTQKAISDEMLTKATKVTDIAGNEGFIWDLFQNKTLSYFLGVFTASTFHSLRANSSINLQGNSADFIYDAPLFSTTASPGSLSWQRGAVIYINGIKDYTYNRRFHLVVISNDARFFIGVSNMYGTTDPTNIEPTSQINSIGIGKLSSSLNLFLIYNDAAGTATSIDLGTNFPANSALYFYDLLIKRVGTTTLLIVRRTTISDDTYITSSTYITTSDVPSTTIYPCAWICNNGSAVINKYHDFGVTVNSHKH
jgi:hypothetical protein